MVFHYVHSGLTDENAQIQDLEAELQKVQAEQDTLPGLIAEVSSELESETSMAEARGRSVDAKETSAKKTLRGVQTVLEMYRDRLALEFENSEGDTMNIIFTKLDPVDASRRFVLKIRVDDDTYEALDCVPPLQDLQDLVDELNSNDNFSKFIRSLRKAFSDAAS